ncbi:glycosyltransferase family 2 protein [Mucilaginibacter sp. L3T2-6]|uniref:glycosyltransferase family 2 protein n=1 Tax=Mucilaginibacter sp. L3T2-6 TaxID=3062491 RepID=UPI00267656C3|nr:glycosyltransferase [Mucilaginibacter sp. L3T2-6]MDO3643705.1 glycosyltransferase [Mucilaginibacter sp. L3T2-6]MDV6216047.1 glycosyltransferase [Mucilaginibacter sp. L3T2-6]
MIHQPKQIKIAVLGCSYNRKQKTARFLTSLVKQEVPANCQMDIFLLDDNSPDGTGNYVEAEFPTVNLIRGSGSLFWAGGMRTLWEHVLGCGTYDFFLLCNDDVVLFDGAVSRLLQAHNCSDHPGNIILGTVQDSEGSSITYGGQKIVNKITGDTVNIAPDRTKLVPCEIGNANIMLVDKTTVDTIGILSSSYTHGIADYDYTLTALRNGMKVWVAPGYYGICDNDHIITWLPQRTPLKKRIEYLYSPKGLAYNEHMVYVKRHFPLSVPITHVKLWVKTLFPIMYDVFKKEKKVKLTP